MYEDKEISKLYGLMPVFLAGSALAGLYTNLEETKWIENLAKKRIYNLSLTIISLVIFFLITRSHAWYNNTRKDAYLYSVGITIFMLLMLISPNNFITQYFSSELLLKKFGTYSYGTYLYHRFVERNIHRFPFVNKYLGISTDKSLAVLLISFCYGYIFFYLVENNSMIIAKIVLNKLNEKLSVYKQLNQVENDKNIIEKRAEEV